MLKYSYEYDNLNQLIRENNVVSGETYLYAYDDAGNILSKQIFPYNTLATSELADAPAYSTYDYFYGQTVRGDRLKEYRNVAITYDAIGNPISYHNGSDYSLTWQNGRQLKRAVKGSEIFLFTYDAEGRRTSKDSYGNKVIYYVWDGDLLVAEYVPYETIYTYFYDASGSPVGFTYTDETGYYEGGVTTTYFYEKNLQGDIVGILDYFGNRIVQYDYDAWGNLIRRTVQSGDSDSANYKIAEDNPFRYRGYYYDRETGFYYLQSRYYDPVTGRFLNADDISLLGANEDFASHNLFVYCGNNPVTRFDFSGYLWDVILDIGFIGWDIYDLFVNEGYKEWDNWVALGVDAVFAAVPFLTGGGGKIVKLANLGDDLHDLSKVTVIGETMTRVQTVSQFVNATDNLYDGFKFYTQLSKFGKVGKVLAEIGGKASNLAWLYGKIKHGYTIVDIGIDLGRINRVGKVARSSSYIAERVFFGVWKYRNAWKLIYHIWD